MTHPLRKSAFLSPEEYLEREHASEVKHEYLDGAVYAMAGASDRHNLVAGNLYVAFSTHLPDRCQVFTADMKLRIRTGKATIFYYPDLLVSCSGDDRERYFREQPIVLGEVLSLSTERTDRTEKFDAYTRIPSMQEYILAEGEIPKVEVFRRRTAWTRETYYPEDRFRLDSVDLELTMAQIYRRVPF